MTGEDRDGPRLELADLAARLRAFSAARGWDPLRPDFEDEMADVLIYLTRLADVTGVDLLAAAFAKMDRNESRFPTTSR